MDLHVLPPEGVELHLFEGHVDMYVCSRKLQKTSKKHNIISFRNITAENDGTYGEEDQRMLHSCDCLTPICALSIHKKSKRIVFRRCRNSVDEK